jgi:DNA modification methylase
MEVRNRKIKDLIRAEYNPRELTKDQENQLKDSLQRFGVVDPVIVNIHPDRKDIIVGGHQRTKVWELMGNKTIPTVEVNLTLEKERELNVRLNKNTGQFDMEMLSEHFDTEELIEWGFSDDELNFFEPDQELEAEDDDYEMPDEVQTDIVPGDLFEIGEHRLLCGDSTNSDDVEKLMNGEKADIMVTDPPYGIDLDTDYSKMPGTNTKYDKIEGDETEFDLKDIISISNTKEQYIWGGDYFTNSIDWNSGTPIVWAKRHSEEENKVFGSAFEILWISYKCKKQIWFIRAINQSSERLGVHPTQKPIECMSRAIEMSKLKGIIYEPFCGSGSTMVASHQLKRKCLAMELSPKYCQVIVDRMMKLDDKLVVKRNGKLYKKAENE